MQKSNGNKNTAIDTMISFQIAKTSTSGFLTGLGGVLTLPITIPADIGTSLFVQMKMIAAIAYINGYDIQSDVTKNIIYSTLVNLKIADIVKQVGIKTSEKFAMKMLQKLPGKIIVKINQKIGFRFITKFGTKGIINLYKIIPVVPGVINVGWNAAETKAIANRAKKEFCIQ